MKRHGGRNQQQRRAYSQRVKHHRAASRPPREEALRIPERDAPVQTTTPGRLHHGDSGRFEQPGGECLTCKCRKIRNREAVTTLALDRVAKLAEATAVEAPQDLPLNRTDPCHEAV